MLNISLYENPGVGALCKSLTYIIGLYWKYISTYIMINTNYFGRLIHDRNQWKSILHRNTVIYCLINITLHVYLRFILLCLEIYFPCTTYISFIISVCLCRYIIYVIIITLTFDIHIYVRTTLNLDNDCSNVYWFRISIILQRLENVNFDVLVFSKFNW